MSTSNSSLNICVLGGAGYVGLITGLGLSEMGHQVINVDVDQDRIENLRNGISPISELGINDLLFRNLKSGSLRFDNDIESAVKESQLIFIAVGTPSSLDGGPDISQVVQVATDLCKFINSYKVLIFKSTLPIGALDTIRGILSKGLREGKDFDLAVNPEFLQEGNGLRDFFCPSRIIVGSDSEKARTALADLYKPLIMGDLTPNPIVLDDDNCVSSREVPFIETDLVSAQMIKYVSNAFLATRISFINEIAGLCGKVGADINEVSNGIGYDPRIGHSYMKPGLGFGGPCLEKDLLALINVAEVNHYPLDVLQSVINRNEIQKTEVITKLKDMVGGDLSTKKIGVFGLAFKSGTNDVRNSLAINVIDLLISEGVNISAYDPEAIKEAKKIRSSIEYCDDPYSASKDAEAILILTGWPCFASLDYHKILKLMKAPLIIDGSNLLESRSLKAMGFSYRGVGT